MMLVRYQFCLLVEIKDDVRRKHTRMSQYETVAALRQYIHIMPLCTQRALSHRRVGIQICFRD